MKQRRYDSATAKALMNFAYQGYGEHEPKPYEIRENGVYAAEAFRDVCRPGTVYDWTPADEMEGPGSPNPDTAPFLPIPFTAAQLAAAMIDGPGQSIAHAMEHRLGYQLGDGALNRFLPRMKWMRDALAEAYEVAAAAQSVVGAFDHEQEASAYAMAQQFEDANGEANNREGVFGKGIKPTEARARRARAVASVADLQQQTELAQSAAADNWRVWRKAMVGQLLNEGSHRHIAKRLEEIQRDEHKERESAADAAFERLETAKTKLQAREKILGSPENLCGIPIEVAEANVEMAKQEVAMAKRQIEVLRGDYVVCAPLCNQPMPPDSTAGEASDMASENAEQYGFYDAFLNLDHWTKLAGVTAREAAMLLCVHNPQKEDFEDAKHTMRPGLPDRHLESLDRRFSDHATQFPREYRSLLDWYRAAQEMQIKLAPEVSSFMAHVDAHANATPTPTSRHAATTMPPPQTTSMDLPSLAGSASSAARKTRRNLLDPAIEDAQKTCGKPYDTQAVWATMTAMAQAKRTPLLGVSDEGIKWLDANDETQFLKLRNLRDRLARIKRSAPERDKAR